MSSSEINFEEAFSILSKNDEYLTLEDAHELISLFVPVTLEEIEGTHFTREDVKNLINKFKNEQSNKNEQLSALLKNMNETIDRNALYQIFKTGNRISFKEFEEFLTHLNLNQTKINTQELYHNLLQQYLL
ncbi:hypothetical protein TpMuguga_02g02275 [Theileria parva strain Muguga]|uniref:uncharacterized protein n=1 Tax=Theileria parva strain Muguga TaxID=333668 RepID=UPI001C61C63D|nr:uncharacterized protein TpMuguga_02g02275 [Theileria parva strain Muguga]KAF5153692.1 hypothetical protein TpMuguga_02g02275 [Theileria parva strain Muguga]